MSTAFYVIMLAGVTWLMAWAALPPAVRSRYWWPFDFREEAVDDKPQTAEAAHRAGSAPRAAGGWRARAGLRELPGAGNSAPQPRRPGASGRKG
jgi:hypothetical protein